MILTVGGVKGGTGKTTLATNLAIARWMQGKEVLLIDGDEQNTAFYFTGLRDEQKDGGSGYSCVKINGGEAMRRETKKLEGKFDDIIIDVGGWDNQSQRGALVSSHVAIFPFQPRTFDAWTMGKVETLVSEAKIYNSELRAYTILNRADPKGSDNEEASQYLKESEVMTFLDFSIGNRKAFSHAAKSGLSVLELKPSDKKAANEILALHNFMYQDALQHLQDAVRC